jgi:hypothetical protein
MMVTPVPVMFAEPPNETGPLTIYNPGLSVTFVDPPTVKLEYVPGFIGGCDPLPPIFGSADPPEDKEENALVIGAYCAYGSAICPSFGNNSLVLPPLIDELP